MIAHEMMMQRCLQLATLGMGKVAPNPLVGAVLVYQEEIIGEGYHEQYGEAHAEVNCLNSVPAGKQSLIPFSTLYVSLEPCVHFGKTPPCTDLIIAKRIPRVVVGCVDSFGKVAGKGIAKMKDAGIEVAVGVMEKECRDLNRRFFTYHEKGRPYIILKWAQSADGFMALPGPMTAKVSNAFADRTVHQWRSEEQAILVGSNTILIDNPRLTNRLWAGDSPVRVILDKQLKLPASCNIFNHDAPSIVYNLIQSREENTTEWIKMPAEDNFMKGVLDNLFERKVVSLMVEGGYKLLQYFINENLWDEARVITGMVHLNDGLRAPVLSHATPVAVTRIAGDEVTYFRNSK